MDSSRSRGSKMLWCAAETSHMAKVVTASPKGRAWDSKGCIHASQRHRIYYQEENTKIPVFPLLSLRCPWKKISILLVNVKGEAHCDNGGVEMGLESEYM